MAKEKEGFVWMATLKDLKTAKQTIKMFEDNKIKAYYIKKTIGYSVYASTKGYVPRLSYWEFHFSKSKL